MKLELMNMCMIYNRDTNEVLVLDKVRKHGWEGLTFPGGHVEADESFNESVKREVLEETGLVVDCLAFRGFVQWMDRPNHCRQIGLLYYTETFTGDLLSHTREGSVYWMDLDEFRKKDGKSWSMEDILDFYMNPGKTELISDWDGKTLSPFRLY